MKTTDDERFSKGAETEQKTHAIGLFLAFEKLKF
jgi:hypothetical protein